MNPIELAEGATYTCRLQGRASAGYTWEVNIEGPLDVVEVSVTSVGERPSAVPGGPPPSTYNLEKQFTIIGIKPGLVKIRFSLQQPWAKGEPPLEERVLEVIVSARKVR